MDPTRIDEVALLEVALAGDPESRRALFRYLTPVIHVRAAEHVAWRRRSGRGGTRADVDDLVQEVWAALLRDGQATLRRWSQDRGASLVSFVGLCAQRIIVSHDRGGARRGARERSTDFWLVDEHARDERGLDERLADLDLVHKLLTRLRARLSPRGQRALDVMFVEGLSVAEAEPRLGMTKSALYTWRREIRSEAHEILGELMASPESAG